MVEKTALMEKLKKLSPEDKALFREALQETDPDGFLSLEEVSEIREVLARKKGKKKGLLQSLDDLFE